MHKRKLSSKFQQETKEPATKKPRIEESKPFIFNQDDDWLEKSKLIGEGGFAKVYLYTDQKSQSSAIKVIPKKQKAMSSGSITNMVENEVKVLRAIESSCNLYTLCFVQFAQDSENYYIVTKYLKEYVPLDEFIEKMKEEDPVILNEIVCQLIAGMEHLHDLSIVHRDLKPNNIMISVSPDEKTHTKIIDFGFACVKDDCTLPFYLGTLDYMAPEIFFANISGNKISQSFEMARRGDLWSMGMTILELFMTEPKTYQEVWQETFAPRERHIESIKLEMSKGNVPDYLEFLVPDFEEKFPKIKLALDSMLQRDVTKRSLPKDLFLACFIKDT